MAITISGIHLLEKMGIISPVREMSTFTGNI